MTDSVDTRQVPDPPVAVHDSPLGTQHSALSAQRPLRIAIDYTSAVNQNAGIGRFVRSLAGAVLDIDSTNNYLLLHAAPNPGTSPEFPKATNAGRRPLRLSERWLNILWHRLRAPVPIDWLTGPVDIFHSPDFVLPP